LKALQAGDVMTGWVATITPDATVKEAAQMMIERRVSGLPVVDRNGRVVGMVSEGDLMRRTEIGTGIRRASWLHRLLDSGAREYLKTRGSKVRDVMSKPVISVRPSTPLHEVAGLLDEKRIKRVPVIDRGRLAGIVSRVDLVRQLALVPARPTARTARERKLRQQVLEAAQSTGAQGLNLNVTVDQGVVHLWGDVRSRLEQKAVLKAVRAVDGARKVKDHTTIIPLRVAAALQLL
jgi:CBS domain-containing protein